LTQHQLESACHHVAARAVVGYALGLESAERNVELMRAAMAAGPIAEDRFRQQANLPPRHAEGDAGDCALVNRHLNAISELAMHLASDAEGKPTTRMSGQDAGRFMQRAGVAKAASRSPAAPATPSNGRRPRTCSTRGAATRPTPASRPGRRAPFPTYSKAAASSKHVAAEAVPRGNRSAGIALDSPVTRGLRDPATSKRR
jgi:hypothetical protein